MTVTEVSRLYARALRVFQSIEDEDANGRQDHQAIPRAVMVFGDAANLIPAFIQLAVQAYPQLNDDDALDICLLAATPCEDVN